MIKMMSDNYLINNKKIPSWPKERDLEHYIEFTSIDFNNDLSDGETWIDVGCRSGKALKESRKYCKAKLIGINAHKIRVRTGIESIYTSIPEDTSVYNKYNKKADIITDIYGAVSYCKNPLEALIYEACLLKSGSKAVIVILEARIGNWERIQQFFKSVMGQKIAFKRFRSYSDNSKTPIKTLRITIFGHCRSKLSIQNLFLRARDYVGQMKETKLIWQAEDKSIGQHRVIYKK